MQTAEQMVIRTPTEVYVDRLASTRYACVEDAVKAAVSAARSTGSTWNVVRWVATGEFTIEEREHAE